MRRYPLLALMGLLLVGCSASTAFYMQGTRALATGDYDRAVQALSSALIENPQHVGALTALGIAHYRREAFEAAIEALEQAQDLAPDAPRVHLYLGLAYLQQGQGDMARKHLAMLAEQARSRGVQDQALRLISVLEEPGLTATVRDYLAYSLELSVQQGQRVEALGGRVRFLESQALYRSAPRIIRVDRCR